MKKHLNHVINENHKHSYPGTQLFIILAYLKTKQMCMMKLNIDIIALGNVQ